VGQFLNVFLKFFKLIVFLFLNIISLLLYLLNVKFELLFDSDVLPDIIL
jgi:hypothetical protein